MSNQVKKKLALAGISVASYDASSFDYWEDYTKSIQFKKNKEEKEAKRKAIIAMMKKEGKIDYQKAYEEAYAKPIYNGQSKYKPRLRIR